MPHDEKTHLSSFMQLQAAAQDSLYASNWEMFYKENCTERKVLLPMQLYRKDILAGSILAFAGCILLSNPLIN